MEETVKLICSNPTCPTSLLMHTNCFAKFEDVTCMKLSKHARCRGWSDRQVRSSVWNQRGYDLAFKFCSCDCGHGHLKKQLEEAKESKEDKKKEKGENQSTAEVERG